MLYGHSVDALLAPGYRVGAWYDAWLFQRGLTSSLFLLLSGFAFSVATARRWSSHLYVSPPFINRTRRFLTFVLLGYSLHFPVPRYVQLASSTPEQWRAFLAVDVLQLIGVTFVLVQVLVLVTRDRRWFSVAAMALVSVFVVATPRVWATPWTGLPLWLSSYLSQDSGSQFPLFPWSAYILLGIVLGQIYGRWGAANLTRYANTVLLGPGVLMVVCGLSLQSSADRLFGAVPASFVPPQFLVRAGCCLLIVGAIAHASGRMARLPHVFGAVAQETLLIYFVHLCIVYGSIWGPGLSQAFGATLGPLQVLVVVITLGAAMTGLAWVWNRVKHRSQRAARWISVGVGAALAVWLV